MMGGGTASTKQSSALQMNGQLTLEQMNLDHRGADANAEGGDEIDPFMMGRKADVSSISLKETNKFMGVSNTIGQQMW